MNRPCRTISARRKGFTLLELLLAMSLMLLLSLSLYRTMSVATNARRTSERAVLPVRSASAVAELMSQDLSSVLPPTGILAGPFAGQHQTGSTMGASADILDFFCVGEDLPPAQQTQPLAEGIRHVELAMRTDVNPPQLVRRVTRNLLTTSQPDVEEEILARNVRSFGLRYFDGTTWTDSWDSTTADDSLPVVIEMTLELAIDPQNESAPTYHVTRLIPLACAKPLADTEPAQ
jgi:type II secretion system protein J